MKFAAILALAASATLSAPVVAQEAAAEKTAAPAPVELHTGMVVYSADGRRIGKIYELVGDRDAPTAIKIIWNSKMISIPADTLSAGDRDTRVKTSLTYDQIG